MIDRRRNRRTAVLASGVILAMLGLTAASVPLYDLFCRVTGYGGTPRVEAEVAPGAGLGSITVLFNADIGKGLPWRFQPAQRSLTLPVGEERLAFYEASPIDWRAMNPVLDGKRMVFHRAIEGTWPPLAPAFSRDQAPLRELRLASPRFAGRGLAVRSEPFETTG